MKFCLFTNKLENNKIDVRTLKDQLENGVNYASSLSDFSPEISIIFRYLKSVYDYLSSTIDTQNRIRDSPKRKEMKLCILNRKTSLKNKRKLINRPITNDQQRSRIKSQSFINTINDISEVNANI